MAVACLIPRTVTNRQRIFVRRTFYDALAGAGEAAPARGVICDRVLDTRARWLRRRGTLLILYTELALIATEPRSRRKAVRVLTAASHLVWNVGRLTTFA